MCFLGLFGVQTFVQFSECALLVLIDITSRLCITYLVTVITISSWISWICPNAVEMVTGSQIFHLYYNAKVPVRVCVCHKFSIPRFPQRNAIFQQRTKFHPYFCSSWNIFTNGEYYVCPSRESKTETEKDRHRETQRETGKDRQRHIVHIWWKKKKKKKK